MPIHPRRHGRHSLMNRMTIHLEDTATPTHRARTRLTFERVNQAYCWLTDKGRSRVVKF